MVWHVVLRRLSQLEKILQGLESVPDPVPELEQYQTPADIAARVIFLAHTKGDIDGCSVLDLGCGNGIFSFGALLAGATSCFAVDCAVNALEAVERNREKLKGYKEASCIDWRRFHIVRGSVGSRLMLKPEAVFDTVFMNPPFGCQRRGADIPFLEAALLHGRAVYTFHRSATYPFISGFVERRGGRITDVFSVEFEIMHTFRFHTHRKQSFSVHCIRIETGMVAGGKSRAEVWWEGMR